MLNNLRVKVKTIFEYEGNEISSDIPSYKTIKYLKEIAKKLFLPIYSEVKLIYDNKDISSFEQMVIGDYFYKKNEINLKVISKNPIINEEEKGNFQNKNETKQLNKDYYCSCKKELISYFCRNCKENICDNCRINSIHLNHNLSQIDINNLNESVKLYAITLQSEISKNIKECKSFLKNKEKENEKEDKNENSIISKHDLIKEKYDKVLEMYNEHYNNLNIIDNENNESSLKNYIKNSKITNEEIDNILNEIHIKFIKKKKSMSIEEFNEYIKLLNEKDEILEINSKDIKKFKVNNQINIKMNIFYEKINMIIDEMLNSKNPFNLDDETYNLYNEILEEKKKEEKNDLIEIDDKKNKENEEENEENEENKEENEHNDSNKENEINDLNEKNENENNNKDVNESKDNFYTENLEDDPEKNLIMQQNAGNYENNEN